MRSLVSFILLATIVVSSTSCGKAQLNKLEGTWEYINFDDLQNLQFRYTWVFESGEIRVNRYPAPSPADPFPQPEHVNSGSYNSKTGFTNATIEIYDLTDDRQNIIFEANWEIADISGEVLRIQTKDIGGHVIREFKRFE